MGQVVAAIAVNAALLGSNYKSYNGAVQSAETLNLMYYMATAIPAGLFLILGLVMLFMYGLNKHKTEELQSEKETLLAQQAANNEIIIGDTESK